MTGRSLSNVESALRGAASIARTVKPLRLIVSVLAGMTVAVVLFYVAVIAFVLVTRGIPLGSEPRGSTPVENAVLLGLAAAAGAIGAGVARLVNPGEHRTSVAALGIVLAVGAIWGFRGSSGWPEWWGPAMALAMTAGAWCGGTVAARKRR